MLIHVSVTGVILLHCLVGLRLTDPVYIGDEAGSENHKAYLLITYECDCVRRKRL